MRIDDIVGVLFIVAFAAGWIAFLIYYGFLWSLAYLAVAIVVFIAGLRWAIWHEQRSGLHEA